MRQSEVDSILGHLRAGNRIQAIKTIRDAEALSLKDAKDIIDHALPHAHMWPTLSLTLGDPEWVKVRERLIDETNRRTQSISAAMVSGLEPTTWADNPDMVKVLVAMVDTQRETNELLRDLIEAIGE